MHWHVCLVSSLLEVQEAIVHAAAVLQWLVPSSCVVQAG